MKSFKTILMAVFLGLVSGDYLSAQESLQIGLIGDLPSSFDPFASKQEATSYITSMIFEPLVQVKYYGGPNPEYIYKLAEHYTVSPDSLEYRFFLRRNVQWHDSIAFTTRDVIYTLNVFLNSQEEIPRGGYILSNVRFFRPEGDYQLVIRLKEPDPFFLLRMQFPIVKEGAYGPQAVITKSNHITKPIGTGPFKFEVFSQPSYLEAFFRPSYSVLLRFWNRYYLPRRPLPISCRPLDSVQFHLMLSSIEAQENFLKTLDIILNCDVFTIDRIRQGAITQGIREEYFIDFVHYTSEGIKKLAQNFSDFLIKNNVVK